MLILLWSSSTAIISGSFVHVCVSSRKLNNLYCLSAGTQPSFEIPIPVITNNVTTSSATVVVNNVKEAESFDEVTNPAVLRNVMENNNTTSTSSGRKDEEYLNGIKDVENLLKVHRSWSSSSTNSKVCDGKGIFVYDLPHKFNEGLMEQCGDMMPWMNFCDYFKNEALGEPISKLGKGWHHTHQYSLEPIFHSRVLRHPCRVYNANEAKLFYVPYYGGLDILRWHFKNVTADVKDSLGLELIQWLQMQQQWVQNSGKDHVFVLGKISWDFRRTNESSSWGTGFLKHDQMQNPMKLLIERQPWELNDIGVPHPTHFHPNNDNDIIEWQLKIIRSKRDNLISFAGAARPGSPENIRSVLIKQCTSRNDTNCRFHDCISGGCSQPETIIKLFMQSEFCLQPPGDSPTRKSVFDSLVSGCIPVLFSPFTAYYQYPWHLPEDHSRYSVFIDEDEVRDMNVNVVERLMNVSQRQREDMRRYIVYELLPGLIYGDSTSEFDKFQDAFSISMNNLLDRVTGL
ncbi:Xyloglucan-specific galacturonosyltransferase [Thalictrum thalictroides]|uniref:Xyloglucan-specific galacturonosyltransferase n=1 Tax=Thalictrum thalictroides TaxID=46969 RepID=A0A7J6W788_THATH|nr:Xyloglucan-specific galacturonosyltransferase [Thalictrum thalictroides]